MAKVENNVKGKVAKIALRRRVTDWLGGAANVRVFDAFAGSGTMWREAWRDAGVYVGCDERSIYDPQRALYVADNERVMRAIDLSRFNVFDLDAFGSPWALAYILANRRRIAEGERVAILTTDGAKLNARFGGIERTFAHLAGVRRDDVSAHAKWAMLTRASLSRVGDMMGAGVEWDDVRDNFGPSKCQVYSAAGMVGRGQGVGAVLGAGVVPVAEAPETPVGALGADCAAQE